MYYDDDKLSIRTVNLSTTKNVEINSLCELINEFFEKKETLFIFFNDCKLADTTESEYDLLIEPLLEFSKKYNPIIISMDCENGIFSKIFRKILEIELVEEKHTLIFRIKMEKTNAEENLHFFKNFQNKFHDFLNSKFSENESKNLLFFSMYFSSQNDLKHLLYNNLPTFIIQNDNLFLPLDFEVLKKLEKESNQNELNNIFEISLRTGMDRDMFENNLFQYFLESKKKSPEI